MKRITGRVAFATVTIALAIAGASFAAGSITGRMIENGSITGADIKNGSLHGADLANGTVKLRDLSPSLRAMLDRAGTPGKDGKDGAPGPQGPKGDTGPRGPKGNGLPDGFGVTNNSVGLTVNGVEFGPYENGGVAGGSLRYTGLNGATLSDLRRLTYTASYSTDDHTDVAVPYLRVFLENDAHDVIFSPNTQTTKDTAEDVSHTWDVLAGSVRYDDDAGTGPDESWADLVDAHGAERISGIYVSAGFSAGQDLTAWLTGLAVNGRSFHFGD